MKIVDWRKFFTFIVIMILFAILVLSIIINTSKAPEVERVEEYEVRIGETLWSIASDYRPSTMSIQEYIFNIQRFNNINSIIYPEQKIQLLIYKEV